MKISWMVFKLRSGHHFMTKITIIIKGPSPKVSKPQLWFLCSASSLMVVNISVKFPKNILNSFQVTEQTWFCDSQTSKINMFLTLKGWVGEWGLLLRHNSQFRFLLKKYAVPSNKCTAYKQNKTKKKIIICWIHL